MSKFVIINIKDDMCKNVSGKAELGRELGVSVPTVTKWFTGRNVYMHKDVVLGFIENDKPKKAK
jgi:hypothetical protein